MYPEKLEIERKRSYFADRDCFTADPWHLVHAYDHKNYQFRMHAHEFYEMNIITAGEGRHYVEGTYLDARVGDIFVLPPEIAHGYYSEGTLDICHVLLRSEFLTRYNAELSALPGFALLFDIEPLIRRSSGQAFHLHIEQKQLAEVRAEATRIMEAERDEEYALEGVLTLGFIGNLGKLLQQKLADATDPAQRGELLRVLEHIQSNFDRKLTLPELAAKANMSTATLNRHFQEILHVSPMQYVLQCRLTHARELLARGELSKTEIAQVCGFYDVAHLNKYL